MNIQSLTSRIIAPFLFEQGSIKVLLPGGFKPPHGGHLHIANQYAANPEVAEVIVLVGPTERDGFTQEQSIAIWNMMPKNPKIKVVTTKYPSPILSAYEYVLSLEPDSSEVFALGSSDKEEDKQRSIEFAQNINGKYKTQGTKKGKKVPQGVTAKVLKTPPPIVYGPRKGGGSGTPISATVLRQDIAQKNFKNFASNYPNVSPDITKKIYNYITDGLTEMYHLPIKNIKSSEGKNPIIDLALEYNPETAKYFRTTTGAQILLVFPDSNTAIKVKKIGNALGGRVELDIVNRDVASTMNPEQIIDINDDNYTGWLKKFYAQNNWVKSMISPIDESLNLEQRRGAVVHLEDLTPFQLLNFLKAWNENNQGFEITEKVDGKDIEFGVDDQGFFTSSRSKKARSVNEYPNNFMFDDFRKFHSELQNTDIRGIASKIAGKPVDSVTIKGEGIASYDANATLYNAEKIGNGVFVIITTTVDGQQFNRQQNETLASELSKQSKIKITATPKVNVAPIKFKYADKLANIINKYEKILTSRATKDTKALKEKILSTIKKIGVVSKEEMLKALKDYKSEFGDEIEGVVFKAPDGQIVKVIDKTQFTARKNLNWHFMTKIRAADTQHRNKIKENPSNIANIIKDFEANIQRIKDEFNQDADKYITVPKKKQETIEYFKMMDAKIAKTKEALTKNTPEEVAQMYIQRQLNEGGSTFGELPNMDVEYRDSTIKNVLNTIKMPSLKYRLIGNYAKPNMNDVDIAVDINEMAKLIKLKGVPDKDTFFDALRKYMNALGLKEYKRGTVVKSEDPEIVWLINTGLLQISFKAPVTDKGGKFMGESIQIDFMIGDPNWMEKVMGPAPGTREGLKAAHRNFLITAAFSQIIMPTDKPEIKKKYQLDFKNGLQVVTFTDKGSKRVKLDVKTIESDPEKMLLTLFKEPISYKDVDTYEKMYAKIMSNQFKYPQLRDKIFQEFVKTVKAMKLNIPDEMKKYAI